MANPAGGLTKRQLEFLRKKLEEERTRILGVLRDVAGAPQPPPEDERSEFEETAQRAAEESDRLDLADRERALLADVERALAKIRTGDYGLDEKTGGPIPYERLAAVPWARGRLDE
jgi:DnaK suppressor protein